MTTGTLPGERLAGLSADLFHKVQKGKITLDELDCFLKRKNPFEMAKEAKEIVVPETFRLTVNYGQSLEEMIAAGRYDWIGGDITAKRYPVEGSGVVEFEARLFNYDRHVESGITIRAIKASDYPTNPWSPAKIDHLLSFGEKFPNEQRKFPIIALGSVAEVGGKRFVPELWEDKRERRLDLGWFEHDWGPHYRFLVVRKVSGT